MANRKAIAMVLGSIVVASSLATYALTIKPPSTDVPAGAPRVLLQLGSSNLYSGKSFSPYRIEVVLGVNSTVRWTNDDNVAHTVTADEGLFDSGILNGGDTWSFRFAKAGTYMYHCTPHSWMTAMVVVKDRASTVGDKS